MIRLDGTSVGGGTATIAGSIAATQIAYGSGTNTIAGSADFTFLPSRDGSATPTFNRATTLVLADSPAAGHIINLFDTGVQGTFNTVVGVKINTYDNDALTASNITSLVVDAGSEATLNGALTGIQISVGAGGTATAVGLDVLDVLGGTINYAITTGAGIVSFGDSVQLANGKAIRGDATSAHTYTFQVYDNDTGPAYVTWLTVTNGNTPSVVIAPPAGGTTITIQATTYKSSDGTSGLASFSGAVSNITVKNGLITAAS